MKFRTCLLFAVLCLAVISLGPAAYASDPWTGLGQTWNWQQIETPPGSGIFICTLFVGSEDGITDNFGIDAMAPFDIGGPAPADDPIIQQYVRNRTPGYWTDWHVVIENGYIMDGALPTVYNESDATPPWNVVPIVDVNGRRTGFDAIAVSGEGTQVIYNQRLFVYFTWRPAAVGEPGYGGLVKITQSPTADYPIPEPASLVGLLSGLAAFGFGLRRRS